MTSNILIAGFGGQGVLFAGKFLAYKGLLEDIHRRSRNLLLGKALVLPLYRGRISHGSLSNYMRLHRRFSLHPAFLHEAVIKIQGVETAFNLIFQIFLAHLRKLRGGFGGQGEIINLIEFGINNMAHCRKG